MMKHFKKYRVFLKQERKKENQQAELTLASVNGNKMVNV